MKKFLLFCFLGTFLLSAAIAQAAPSLATAPPVPATIQQSFETYIQNTLAPIYTTYTNNRYSLLFLKGDPLLNTKDGWIKTQTLLHKTYKTAVTAHTDSYQGMLEINSTTRIYPLSSSTAMAAKQAKPTSSKGDTYRYTFLYQNNQWKIASAKSFESVQRRWFPSDNNLIKTLRCPDDKQ